MGLPSETSEPVAAAPDLGSIYAMEVGYVWETLHRLGVRSGDVEDIAHNVFVTIHRRLADYDARRPIRPWIFGICYRVASDYRRSARIRHEVGADGAPDPIDQTLRADEQLAARDARKLVIAALDTLPDEQRAVFVLHELDGIAMPEIAISLDAPLETLYSRLRLARKKFAAAVRQQTAAAVDRQQRAGGSR